MIRRDSTLFFVHVPRTAGSFTQQILLDLLDLQEKRQSTEASARLLYARSGLSLRCLDAPFVGGHLTVDAKRFMARPNIVTMAFFRSPVKQVVSMFSFLKETGQVDRTISLDVFLSRPEAGRLINIQTRWLCATCSDDMLPGFDPPTGPIDEALSRLSEPQLLDRAIEVLEREVDLVFIQDRMQESQRQMETLIGVPHRSDLPHVNRMPAEARIDLSPDVLEQLKEFTRLDRQLFDRVLHRFGMQATAHLRKPGSCKRDTQRFRIVGKNAFVPGYSLVTRNRPAFIDFTHPVRGTNWMFREFGNGGPQSCWTGPGNSTTLEIECGDAGHLGVSFRLYASIDEKSLRGLNLKINGEYCGLYLRAAGEGDIIYVSDLHFVERPGRITLEFYFENAKWIAQVQDSVDPRKVGNLFSWILVSLLAPAPAWSISTT